MNRLHRSPDKSIAGVCSGIAETFGIEPILVRLAFLASLFFGGSGLLLYIILWIILPVEENHVSLPQKKLYRSRSERFIGGVCGGLAKYLDWDVSIIRLIFIVLILSLGSGLLLYLLLWILIPLEPNEL